MSESSMNSYPSVKVQQYTTTIAFLIDCDEGLSAAFHSEQSTAISSKLIEHFPPNSDIFLFFNSNDSDIVEGMKELKSQHPNVHIFPNIIANSKNGADMNLSFTLGGIHNKYDNYVIIARYDRAYVELKQRLIDTRPHLENHVELRRFNDPDELTQYVYELDKVQQDELILHTKSAGIPSTNIKFTSDSLFHHCPLESWQQSSRLYRFAELLDHLDDKHSEIHYHYCPTCEEMVQEDNWSEERNEQYDEHFRKEHLDNNAGFNLSIQQ